MFTGIVETTGEVVQVTPEDGNVRLVVRCPFAGELQRDQSVAHNGACLTVDAVGDGVYEVVCIAETLRRTNLGRLQPGDAVNLERSVRAGDRLDGHIVQGHVDVTGVIRRITPAGGSWEVEITYDAAVHEITVEKGSVCVNGVSLTVVESHPQGFRVDLIPYTFEHTTFRFAREGDRVNIEFDILGKYIQKLVAGA